MRSAGRRMDARTWRTVIALTVLLASAACMPQRGSSVASTVPAPGRPVIPPDSATIARVRADSIRRPYTQADIDFMSRMIPHHAQAIVMARMAQSHGASPAVQRLASRIINAQQDEIVTIQQWLADRRLPVPDAAPRPVRMVMNGVEHDMLMPGMLTGEQMKQLEAARGGEFDRLFLRYMIQHHTGAIAMVRELFASYGAGQDELVFKFASDVNVDQTTEIARMQQMLAGAPSTPTQRN